jgi:hypothetical protein
MNRQVMFENWRGKFFFIFVSFLFSSLEVIRRKCKVSRVFISILFSLLFLIGFAQPEKRARIVETHNLEIIWQKPSPDSVFYFGRSLASGDVNGDGFDDLLIIGDSVLHSTNPDSFYRGRCWIFYGGVNLDTIPDICLLNLQKRIFGVIHSADINGDGFDDVLIGACYNQWEEVLIFLGSNQMDTICDYRIRGPSVGSIFGCEVSSGDVNGDGYNDLIVGAYGAAPHPGGYGKGQVYIYYGGPDFDIIPDVILNGGHENDIEGFGSNVNSGGDVNRDGYEDIIIGAMNFGSNLQGRIYIYFGGNPMDTTFDVTMTGSGFLSGLGECGVDLLSNVNDFSHAVAGANGYFEPGRVYVLYGGNPMDSIPDLEMIGRTNYSMLGTSTTNAGFTNRPGASDLLAGAPVEYESKGTAYLWLGGTLLDTNPDAWIRGSQPEDEIGWTTTSAGDVDGDRRDEIMISNTASNFSTKRVWVCKYTGGAIEEKRSFRGKTIGLKICPNTVTKEALLRYKITAPCKVSLKVFNIEGKLIKVLEAGYKSFVAGEYEISWNLRDDQGKKVQAGIYIIEFIADDKKQAIRKTGKIIVVK